MFVATLLPRVSCSVSVLELSVAGFIGALNRTVIEASTATPTSPSNLRTSASEAFGFGDAAM